MDGSDEANAEFIGAEIAWLRRVLELRLQIHAGEHAPCDPLADEQPPPLPGPGAHYADVVRRFEMGPAERLLLVLGFVPGARPDVLDPLFIQNRSLDRRFTEFGGVLGFSHGGVLPTAETALFLLAAAVTNAWVPQAFASSLLGLAGGTILGAMARTMARITSRGATSARRPGRYRRAS